MLSATAWALDNSKIMPLTPKLRSPVWKRIALVGIVLIISLIVRAGTAHFLAERIDDGAWFQHGSYKIFDARAQGILDGTEPVFFLNDPTRTDLVQYPPGFPLLVAFIYQVTGERSALAVLSAIWWLDALATPLLLFAVGTVAFDRRAGYCAAAFGAFSPLLAYYGVTPSSDPVTTWIVLGALLTLLFAVRKHSWTAALAAGAILGLACWFRVNPLFLTFAWGIGVLLTRSIPTRRRAAMAMAVVIGTVVIAAPIPIRNAIVFKQVVMTGLNVGSNLWEGLGETELGNQHGFRYGDQVMVEVERAELGLAADFPITPVWPDGIARDRERARRSLAFIAEHPVWYSGVMLTRMYWMLKIAGDPGPYYGTAGINCTRTKCLPVELQNGAAAVIIDLVGMAQSVLRYVTIPLAAIGLWFGLRRHRAATFILLATVLYYLVAGTAAHTELRYVLPMHAVLVVLAGLALSKVPFARTRDRQD